MQNKSIRTPFPAAEEYYNNMHVPSDQSLEKGEAADHRNRRDESRPRQVDTTKTSHD